MKRTKLIETKPLAKVPKTIWRNKSGGFRLKSMRYIGPGVTFEAYPDEIPQAFRDVIVPLGEVTERTVDAVKEKEIEVVANEVIADAYVKRPRTEGGMWFDIFDKNNKQFNEKALREKAADEMLKSLNG